MDRPGLFPAVFLALFACLLVPAPGCGGKRPGKVVEKADPPNTPCGQSEKCRVWGWCGEKQGECAPTADEHCRASSLCKRSGLCTLDAGTMYSANKCVARNNDCSGTEWCDKFNLCDATEGVCK